MITGGPMGASLNTEEALDFDMMDGPTVFEIGQVDSLRDQRFLAELMLMHVWQRDRPPRQPHRRIPKAAHRDGGGAPGPEQERPPEQRGDRTLLELAVAEARRYGWGFLIVDQMPRCSRG